jgi:hypothetical protein
MKVVIGDHFSGAEDKMMKVVNRIAGKVMK